LYKTKQKQKTVHDYFSVNICRGKGVGERLLERNLVYYFPAGKQDENNGWCP